MSLKPDSEMIKLGLGCLCPQCKTGKLYKSSFSLTLRDRCSECGLDLSKNDSADGPAVFLIFILGALLVPIALILDAKFTIPLWMHGVLWSAITLGLTLGMLKPIKAYIIALQYKHTPESWK